MNTLSTTEWVRLAKRGIIVRREYVDGLCCCWAGPEERWYLASDLKQIAKPGWVESMRAWMAGEVSV